METLNHQFPWLELIERPVFCVRDGRIIAANTAAENRQLQVGTDVREIVTEHREAYETFQNGSLYLTVSVCGIPCSASVTRTKECDIFLLPADTEDEQLQALALAAQQLRRPLGNVMAVSDRLLSSLDGSDGDVQQLASEINHNLFQLLRIIFNMSDAGRYQHADSNHMQTVDLTAVISEIMEKAQTISESTGIKLRYSGLNAPVFTLVSEDKLERAIYNILSNAMKFSPTGSTVDASLTKNGNQLAFTVSNQTENTPAGYSFWQQYRREQSLSDNHGGLGLGMTLVSAVAALHKGTVLVDHPTPGETRVTMSIPINTDTSGIVRSQVMGIGNYAGERDIGLLELSEILPADAYKKIN